MFMQVIELLALRNVSPETLIANYATQTSELFSYAARLDKPDVVVIPACNEERDITSTLLSLSKSVRPVVPIVVENGSSTEDKTYEYAERMGAIAVHCAPSKMRATQVGLMMSRERFPRQPITHFGDADNLYPRACIATVSTSTEKSNKDNNDRGALVFGMGAYDHGLSRVVDVMRTGRLVRKAVGRKLRGEAPMPYGFNYALHTGHKPDEILEALNGLDPQLFVREESEICKAALASGLIINQTIRPASFVFTRSDLIQNHAEWREFKGASMATKTKYYKRNYPDVNFIPNDKGRG
jgi:hypothetical protein